MNTRTSVQDIYKYVARVLAWVILIAASGSLQWVIIGGVAASGLAFIVSRQWKRAATTGVAATIIISALGIMAMISPGWYKNLL